MPLVGQSLLTRATDDYSLRRATMKTFLQGLRRWYLRRFKGYVAPPRDAFGVSRGTAWQEHHQKTDTPFICRCGQQLFFLETDYVIREQDHGEDCMWQYDEQSRETRGAMGRCSCPVTDARYVKICPKCGLGHWKVANLNFKRQFFSKRTP
jgi:hypothetical protein